MWELNPPMQLLTTITGFEDQRAHQHPSTPIEPIYYIIKILQFQHYFYCFSDRTIFPQYPYLAYIFHL